MHDRELFLKNIPQDGGIGNGRLQSILGWDNGKYNAIRESLINEGKIVPARGRGGAVRFANEKTLPAEQPVKEEPLPEKEEIQKIDRSQYASDEDAIFAQLPDDGGLSKFSLMSLLDLTEERYLAAKENLLRDGKVLPSRGRGGAIRRRKNDEEPWQPKEEKETLDLTQFESYEEAFMSLVPEEGEVDIRTIKSLLSLDSEIFKDIKQTLLLNGSIVPGERMTIRRRKDGEDFWQPKEEKTSLDLSQFESEEDAFMSQVPEEEEINLRTLNALLGFETERFREIKHDLLVKGKIVPGEGRATIRRRKEDEEFWQDESPEPRKKDSEEDEDGIPKEIPDPVIFQCSEESTAQKILDALHAKYRKSVFYVDVEGIKLKLNKYAGLTVPIRSEKLGEVVAVAEEAFNSLSASKTENPAENALAEEGEKVSTEEKAEAVGA